MLYRGVAAFSSGAHEDSLWKENRSKWRELTAVDPH